uniref:C2H2-type domain-containing protein n=1 Tax=Phlebotomus papatasi TaxID=29031 RepID=A0A1B0D9S6_PHLPP
MTMNIENYNCLQQLKNAFSFREMCLETRKKFFGRLKNQVDQSIAVENAKDESVGDKVGQEECPEAHQFTSSPLTKEFLSQKTSPKNHSKKYLKIPCKATKLSPQKVLLNKGHKRIGHKIEEEASEIGTNYLCSTCGKSFKTRQRLQNHIITHTGEKKFSCSICSKRFAIASSLKNHMRIHTGDKPYKCLTCGLCFSQRNCAIVGFTQEKNHLLADDYRRYIALSTFGFYQGGILDVKFLNFQVPVDEERQQFGLSLDKTLSDAMNPYLDTHQDKCILNEPASAQQGGPIIFIHFDLENKTTHIDCSRNWPPTVYIYKNRADIPVMRAKRHSLAKVSDSSIFH